MIAKTVILYVLMLWGVTKCLAQASAPDNPGKASIRKKAKVAPFNQIFPDNVLEIMKNATQMELFSLEPVEVKADGFHGWKILGKTKVKQADRLDLVGFVAGGVELSEGRTGVGFLPHHGIRAISKSKSVDILISFQCLKLRIYVGGESKPLEMCTLNVQENSFNEILKKAGVKLAKSRPVKFKQEIHKQVLAIMDNATQVELFSLEPTEVNSGGFHGWTILGKKVMKKERERTYIIDSVKMGIDSNDGKAAACFFPRHGVRAVYKDDVVDFVICFQCMHVHIYIGKEKKYLLTSDLPEKAFDNILKNAGIKLADKEMRSGK